MRAIKRPTTFENAIYGDIVRGLRIDPESCDLVFASHVLEHLTMPDFEMALCNIYMYLRLGGLVRVIVPDLHAFIETYRPDAEDAATASEAAPRFMTRAGVAGGERAAGRTRAGSTRRCPTPGIRRCGTSLR